MSAEISVGKKPDQSIANRLINRLIVSRMIEDLPRFTQAIPIAFPNEFEEQLEEKMLDERITPIIVSSHTSHADGIPLAALTKRLKSMSDHVSATDRLKGFVIPIASSMESGHQGSIVKEGTDRLRDIVKNAYNLETLAYTRDKDVKQYGLSQNAKFAISFFRRVRDGHGVAVFPEGTMQAGRTKKYHLFGFEQYGMQEFKELEDVARNVIRAGKVPLYIPVGIYGGFRIESPNNNRLTFAYLNEILLTHPAQTKLVSVKVGAPIAQSEVDPDQNINSFLGKKVAQLLPPEARGVYA